MAELVTYLPIGISVVALGISSWFAFANQRHGRAAFRISREREIYDWAQTTLSLSPDLKSGEQKIVDRARNALSTQIDVGRLLFPNDVADDFGNEKHPLNRGYRSEVLDPLIQMYRCDLRKGRAEAKKFDAAQKQFVHKVGKHFTPVKTHTSPKSRAHK